MSSGKTLRGADVAARFGGEEFSILLPQTTAEKQPRLPNASGRIDKNRLFRHRSVTASIGIASSANETGSPEELINAADSVLYEAKNQGRNNVQIFDGLAWRRRTARST